MKVANFSCNLQAYTPPTWTQLEPFNIDELNEKKSDVSVVVWNNNMHFRSEYFRLLPNMDLFINWGTSDTNLPDEEQFDNNGVQLKSIDAYSTTAVAQFILSQILYYEQTLPIQEGELGRELYGKSVGIVGLGKIGFVTANMLQGHNMEISYTCASGDKHVPNMNYVEDVSEMLKDSDYVIVTAKSNDPVLSLEDFDCANTDMFLLNVASTESFAPELGSQLYEDGKIRKFVSDHEDRGLDTPSGVSYTPHVAYKTREATILKCQFLDFYLHKYHNALLPEDEQPRAFILRHGVTKWNREGRIQGRGNSDLTRKGSGQARAAVKLLKENGVERIIHSPLGRTQQFANIISRGAKIINTRSIRNLVEMDFGYFQGEKLSVLHSENPNFFAARQENKVLTPFPGGESYFDLYQRLLPVILRESRTSSNIAMIGHESTNRVIRGILTEKPLESVVNDKQSSDHIIEVNLATGAEIRHVLVDLEAQIWNSTPVDATED